MEDDFYDFLEDDELDFLEERSFRNSRLSHYYDSCFTDDSSQSKRVNKQKKATSSNRRPSTRSKTTSPKKEKIVYQKQVPENHFWSKFFLVLFEFLCFGFCMYLLFFQ